MAVFAESRSCGVAESLITDDDDASVATALGGGVGDGDCAGDGWESFDVLFERLFLNLCINPVLPAAPEDAIAVDG
jgi:hypothetical protein